MKGNSAKKRFWYNTSMDRQASLNKISPGGLFSALIITTKVKKLNTPRYEKSSAPAKTDRDLILNESEIN